MTTKITPESVKYPRGKHPNTLKNLKPFPKGHNGNPNPGYSLTSRLRDSLKKPLKKPKGDAPVGDLLVYSTLVGALEREPTPFRETWDRVDGKLQDNSSGTTINADKVIVISKIPRSLPEGKKEEELT